MLRLATIKRWLPLRGKDISGKIDGIADGAMFEEVTDLIDDHNGAIFFRFFGGCTEMGQSDNAHVIGEQITGKIADVSPHFAGENCLRDRFFRQRCQLWKS